MILITMAISLAACSGSSGSDGAAGADGTIELPTDSDLAITASTTPDADLTLGQVSREFTLSGTDNLSADARDRYYAYLSTDGSAKSSYMYDNTTVSISGYTSVVASTLDAWPIDTRLKQADNLTLTFMINKNLGDGDGSTTHIIVCKGNEAGDATSCASVDLGDRGAGAEYESTDNDSVVGIFNQSGTIKYVVGKYGDAEATGAVDNITSVSSVTDSKGSTPSTGTATSISTPADGDSPSDLESSSDTIYVLATTGSDNYTLYQGDTPTTDTGVFDNGTV